MARSCAIVAARTMTGFSFGSIFAIGAVGTTLLEGADPRLLPTAFTAATVKV